MYLIKGSKQMAKSTAADALRTFSTSAQLHACMHACVRASMRASIEYA